MTSNLVPPLKWHGGKNYLAERIIGLMPARCKNPNDPDPSDPGWLHYVEPYAGGLAVLLANDPEGVSEVVNDIYKRLANFWHVLANPACFEEFARIVQAVPFSQAEWEYAGDQLNPSYYDIPDVDRAVKFFVLCRQSLAGRMDGFAPLSRSRTRRGMNEQASAWLSAVEGLPAVHARLTRVVVLNRDAVDVIRKQDGPRTLFYLDPPYLPETRASVGEYGPFEMTPAQHQDLLDLLATLRGRFLLSGYWSEMYHDAGARHGWRRVEFEVPNNAAGCPAKRRMTECVWMNYP